MLPARGGGAGFREIIVLGVRMHQLRLWRPCTCRLARSCAGARRRFLPEEPGEMGRRALQRGTYRRIARGVRLRPARQLQSHGLVLTPPLVGTARGRARWSDDAAIGQSLGASHVEPRHGGAGLFGTWSSRENPLRTSLVRVYDCERMAKRHCAARVPSVRNALVRQPCATAAAGEENPCGFTRFSLK